MVAPEKLMAALAVRDTGSFRAGAARLNKTQSAISKAIAELERQVGIRLFDRAGYRPVITPAGRAYLRQAERLVAGHRQLDEYARFLEAGAPVAVRLAVEAVVDPEVMIEPLARLQSRFPSVALEWTCGTYRAPARALSDGEADIAIAAVFPFQDGFQSKRLRAVELVNAATPEVAGSFVRAREAGETFRSPQIFVRDRSEAVTSLNDLGLPFRWTVDDFATKTALIEAGLGWGRLPRHMAGEALDRGRLAAFELPGMDPRLSLDLWAVRAERAMTTDVMELIWDAL